MQHAYFSSSNQPIKFSMLRLLNDEILTSLSYNQRKFVLTGCPSFPLRPGRPLNPGDPLSGKNVNVNLLMTSSKFKSKSIATRSQLLTRSPLGPFRPGRPLLPRHPWEEGKHVMSTRIARNYKINRFQGLEKVW